MTSFNLNYLHKSLSSDNTGIGASTYESGEVKVFSPLYQINDNHHGKNILEASCWQRPGLCDTCSNDQNQGNVCLILGSEFKTLPCSNSNMKAEKKKQASTKKKSNTRKKGLSVAKGKEISKNAKEPRLVWPQPIS